MPRSSQANLLANEEFDAIIEREQRQAHAWTAGWGEKRLRRDLRIVIGSGGPFVPMLPDSQDVFGNREAGFGAHAIDRAYGPLGAGTYTVKVQWYAPDPAYFEIDASTLTVERVVA